MKPAIEGVLLVVAVAGATFLAGRFFRLSRRHGRRWRRRYHLWRDQRHALQASRRFARDRRQALRKHRQDRDVSSGGKRVPPAKKVIGPNVDGVAGDHDRLGIPAAWQAEAPPTVTRRRDP